MIRRITPDDYVALREGVVELLRQRGIDMDPGRDDSIGVVLVIVEPREEGYDTLHLGAWGLSDEGVLQALAEAPNCIAETARLEAGAQKHGGSA